MKIIETKVFTFEELSDSAKEKARDWYRSGDLNDEWWDHIYEDAKRAGLKITSFDLDRNRHAEGEITVFGGMRQVIGLILQDHGKDCETFKTATKFLAELDAIDKACEAEDGDDETNVMFEEWQEKRAQCEGEFLQSILEDYSILLQKESEWLVCDESVDANILANEYTFTADGKRF